MPYRLFIMMFSIIIPNISKLMVISLDIIYNKVPCFFAPSLLKTSLLIFSQNLANPIVFVILFPKLSLLYHLELAWGGCWCIFDRSRILHWYCLNIMAILLNNVNTLGQKILCLFISLHHLPFFFPINKAILQHTSIQLRNRNSIQILFYLFSSIDIPIFTKVSERIN